MRCCVLASGSKGNCTYIETEHHKCLIDVGMNFLYTSSKLEDIGVHPKEIDSIFITHTHKDHIYGLKKFLKESNATVYLTDKMYQEIGFPIANYTFLGCCFTLDDLQVEVLKMSHDTEEAFGYIFKSDTKSVVYITDTGYINVRNHPRLKNKSMYIIESNHDVDMLMKGKYPYHLKMRILGDKGHLSNKDSSYYLSNFIGINTKYIVLAHLSEENNTPELALSNLQEMLSLQSFSIKDVMIATQNERTEMVEL